MVFIMLASRKTAAEQILELYSPESSGMLLDGS
jgi:hypothetical protein